ncbi:hypothetical protein C0993_004067 [Termitomyces sp. T159_Od127]|nr:hypothetical protein C0993_004067 [Termitomyces sp. T159_Od127]
MDVNQPVHNALRLALNVLGCKQKTELPLVDKARLLHMETLFSQITPVLEQLGPAANGVLQGALNSTVTPGSEQNTSALSAIRELVPQGAPPEPSTAIKSEDDVSESFGQLALDEYGAMRWIGGSSTMSLIQSFRALTSSPLHRISPMEEDPNAPGPSVNKIYFPASVFFGKVQVLPEPEEVEFPERDLADKLVAAYFSRFHFLMPVLDKSTFLRQYNLIMDNLKDHTLIRSQTAFLSVVFAVFSCAAYLVQDGRLVGQSADDGGMGMIYYERLGYSSGKRSELRSPRKLLITAIEKETRKKVWWGVYTLDRMLALALGRPLGINDSDCDVEQPAEVDDDYLTEYFSGATMPQPRPSLMTGSVALNRLYEIGGRVLRQVYALDICRDHLEPEKKAELQHTVESLGNAKRRGSSSPVTVPSGGAVPPSPTSTVSQRRRSVTIVTNAPGSAGPGRIAKGRSNRRNQSRDPSTSSRRMAAVSPYRVDSGNPTGRPYYQPFAGSAAGASVSPHSSPSSANLPSPSMSVVEQTAEAASPNSSQAPSFKYSTATVAAQPSPPRFESYEFAGLQSSPLVQSNPNPWNGNEDQLQTGLDMYVTGDSALYPNTYGYPSSLDYPAFDAGDSTVGGLTVTPSSTNFAATGLPFRGLEYIRNFNSGAFGFDPDLAFSLSDHPLDLTNNMTNNNQ